MIKEIKSALAKSRRAPAVFSLLLCFGMFFFTVFMNVKHVTINDDDQKVITVQTIRNNTADILDYASLEVSEHDTAELSEDEEGYEIEVERAFSVTVVAGRYMSNVYTTGDTVKNILDQTPVVYDYPQTVLNRPLNEYVDERGAIRVDFIERKTVKEVEEIPFEIVRKPSSELARGYEEVTSAGVKGEYERVYKITYKNGTEVEKTLVSEGVLKQPQNQVIKYGTSGFVTTLSGESLKYSKVLDMTAYAYVEGGRTATGQPARRGVVAVDPKVIPLRSKLYVVAADGKTWEYGVCSAQDTGGSIKGNKIDLCVETNEIARKFGVKKCKVYIIVD